MPSTRRRTPQRTVGVDEKLWKKCQRIADVKRETLADVMRRALVDYAERNAHLDPGDPDGD